jgi:hypothetical protein
VGWLCGSRAKALSSNFSTAKKKLHEDLQSEELQIVYVGVYHAA